ncbi:MAG: hypothetical protein J1F02_03690 [Lachnospiraceae bacterium]|nr:hypothetical protein [Lachnospiraceae bacterium]
MFRIWGKVFRDNRLLQDMVYEDSDLSINRTKKVFAGLHEFCMAFDLQEPIWLDKNIEEFKRVDKTRFYQDNFIETVDFDYLEIQVIEED